MKRVSYRIGFAACCSVLLLAWPHAALAQQSDVEVVLQVNGVFDVFDVFLDKAGGHHECGTATQCRQTSSNRLTFERVSAGEYDVVACDHLTYRPRVARIRVPTQRFVTIEIESFGDPPQTYRTNPPAKRSVHLHDTQTGCTVEVPTQSDGSFMFPGSIPKNRYVVVKGNSDVLGPGNSRPLAASENPFLPSHVK